MKTLSQILRPLGPVHFARPSCLVCLMCLVSLPARSAQAVDYAYTVKYLGNFSPTAINNNGDVVGFMCSDSGSGYISVVRHGSGDGKLIDIGSLGGFDTFARDINDNGDIVGDSDNADGMPRGFLFHKGTMLDIGTLGGATSFAHSINNLGQIVGSSKTSAGTSHAFLFSGGAMQDLGTLGGANSGAGSINDAGQIVGASDTEDGTTRAFLAKDGSMNILATLGWSSGAGNINKSGMITGCYNLSYGGTQKAFLHYKDEDVYLESEDGAVALCGINDSGEVVGISGANPFLYKDKQMYLLNDLIDSAEKVQLSLAMGINNHGQIIGWGAYNGETESHAFLLTPVPEPSVLISLGVAFAGILLVTWRNAMRITRLHHFSN